MARSDLRVAAHALIGALGALGALMLPLFALGIVATPARAQQPAPARGAAMSWVRLAGAEDCIAPVELAAQVEARLGRAVFVRPLDAIVVVEGSVGPSANGGFLVQLSVSDTVGKSYGTRELQLANGSCRQLDEMVALVIAVTLRGGEQGMALPTEISAQLDALFEDEPTVMAPTELSAEPPSPPAAEAEPLQPPKPRQSSEPKYSQLQTGQLQTGQLQTGFQLGLDAAAMAATGVQPDGTIGPSLRLRFAVPHVGVALLAAALGLSQQLRVTDLTSNSDGLLTLTPTLASLSLCLPEQPQGALALLLCARLGLGQLKTTAERFMERNGHQTDLWSELGPEASLRTPLASRLYVWLGVSLPIRLSRPELVYVKRNAMPATAYRMAGISVLGTLGLGVDLL